MTSTPTDPNKTGKLPIVDKLIGASRNKGPALPDPDTLDASDAEAYAQLKRVAPSAGAKSSFIVASQRVSSLL